MDSNFQTCLQITLRHEGGWADHPRDPGGATMKGVTLATFRAFKGRQVTKTELRNISDADLNEIYRRDYWLASRANNQPKGMDLCLFDAAVNSGPARARTWLGRTDPAGTNIARIKAYQTFRRSFLNGLAHFKTFGTGWLRRLADIEARALLMAGGTYPVAIARKEATKAKNENTAAAAASGASPAVVATDTAQSLPPALLWAFVGLAAVIAGIFIYNALAQRARERAFIAASATGDFA